MKKVNTIGKQTPAPPRKLSHVKFVAMPWGVKLVLNTFNDAVPTSSKSITSHVLFKKQV